MFLIFFVLYANDAGPDNTEFFTIKMHHSGKFLNLSRTCYLAGAIDYFDYCSGDEMSMIEISEMGKELVLKDVAALFHSRGLGINESDDLHLMETDMDAMNIVNFVDENRVTSIYVKHHSISETKRHLGDSMEQFPEIDEAIGYVGDVETEHMLDNDTNDQSDIEADINIDQNTSNVPFDQFDINDGLLDMNDSGGSDKQSIGNDSEHSDFLVDSECFESQDDFDYDEYADFNAERGGLRETPIVEEKTRRYSRGKKVVEVEDEVVKEPKNQFTHHNYPVFNPKVDMAEPQLPPVCLF